MLPCSISFSAKRIDSGTPEPETKINNFTSLRKGKYKVLWYGLKSVSCPEINHLQTLIPSSQYLFYEYGRAGQLSLVRV